MELDKQHHVYSDWAAGLMADVVTVNSTGPGRFIFLSGLGPEDEDGPPLGGDIRGRGDFMVQCRYIFDKMRRYLARHDAGLGDIVKITTYLTDPRQGPLYAECLTEAFGDLPRPAHTCIVVSQLAFPDILVEVDATAIAAPA